MSQFINAVIVIVFIRIIPRSIGWESYGVWALLSTGLRYPMILENAFSLSTNRFVAYYHNDKEQLNRYVSASFLILLILAVFTVIISVILSFYVTGFFKAIPQNLAYEAQITCILVGVTLSLKILESTFSGALMGYQYHTRYNSIAGVTNIIRMVLTIVMLRFWNNMISVQIAFVISALLSLISIITITMISIPSFKINLFSVHKQSVYELFRYTGHTTARSGSLIFMYSTLALIIGKVGTAENISVYDVASRISGFVNGLLAGAHNVFLPAVTNLFANNKTDKIKAVIKKGTHISSVITCAIQIIVFIYAEAILKSLLKEMFIPEMVLITRIMMLSVIPRGFFGIWIPSLAGMGHLREMTIAAISTVIGAIALEVVFLKVLVSIPMAPALSQMIALWAYMGIWLPFYGLYKIGIKPLEYFKSSFLAPLSASVVSVILLRLLNYLVPGDIHWIIMFLISSAIIFICFGVISLHSETMEIYNLVKRKLSTAG